MPDLSKIVVLEEDLSQDATDSLLRSDVVAWDIETSGLNWQSDRIGLCQVFAQDGPVYVVRPTWRRPERLVHLLQSVALKKIFHHAMFDLRFMCHQWDVFPYNVACTKIASKLLDPKKDFEHTLKDLLQRYLGVPISKAERTSDWFTLDLTEAQLRYAATDVVHLIPLMDEVECHLRKEKISGLAYACFAHLPTRVRLEILGYDDVYSY
jgi:ribonuclease D